MGEDPSARTNDIQQPAPETLVPRANAEVETTEKGDVSTKTRKVQGRRYKVSHKATFIGLFVVVIILVVNAGIIAFVLRDQSSSLDEPNKEEVIISQEVLDGLGVNRASVGDLGVELVVGPDARFNGTVEVGGALSIGGALTLNSPLTAGEATLTNLQAGNTALQSLNVNGDITGGTLNLRNDINVTGASRLAGTLVVGGLITANNSLNVTGNLAVGGQLIVGTFYTSDIVAERNISLGGHFITRGSAPSISAGTALGSNGTVAISGSDAAGTVSFNVGVGATSGSVASVTFRAAYDKTPRVVVTPVGGNVGSFYIQRSSTGFTIYITSGMSPGGYAFDYFVIE